MTYFLAKTEPGEYSIDDLEKIGEDYWDGVTNPQALQAIKSMKVGDKVLIYHSGKNPSLVGIAEVSKEAVVDTKNPKSFTPWFKFKSKFENPITLEEIKASNKFNDFALVRQGRLSTMVVPDGFLDWLRDKGLSI